MLNKRSAFSLLLIVVSVFFVSCNKDVGYILDKKKESAAKETQKPSPASQNVVGSTPASSQAPIAVTPQGGQAVTAILSGVPTATSSNEKLSISVGGQGVVEYQYALLANASDCQPAKYSDWRPIARIIDDRLSLLGNMIICVNGRTDQSNLQQKPTTHAWIQVAPPDLQATLSNVPNDGNVAKTLNVIVGGLGVTQFAYTLIDQSKECPVTQPSNWTDVTVHIVDEVSTPGKKRLCVVGKNSAGKTQNGYTIHDWIQGEQTKQEAPITDPKPQSVRIDLTKVNFESWSKVCLFISAAGGPFEKMGCNKQDSEKVKEFLEFKAPDGKCVTLDFRLEVYQFAKSCAGLTDLSTCQTSPISDPVRMTSTQADAAFFRALPVETITPDSLAKNNIDKGNLTPEVAAANAKEAAEWLKLSTGRQWIRFFVEDQTNAQMEAFKKDNNASLHGIDFDDYVVDIRSIDIGFKIPRLGIECAPR